MWCLLHKGYLSFSERCSICNRMLPLFIKQEQLDYFIKILRRAEETHLSKEKLMSEEAFEKRQRLEEKIRVAQTRAYMKSPREIIKNAE